MFTKVLFALIIFSIKCQNCLTFDQTIAEIFELNTATLNAQNKFRTNHGTAMLQLNSDLVKLAQEQAEAYAKTGNTTSTNYKGKALGRNIVIFKGLSSINGILFILGFKILCISISVLFAIMK